MNVCWLWMDDDSNQLLKWKKNGEEKKQQNDSKTFEMNKTITLT